MRFQLVTLLSCAIVCSGFSVARAQDDGQHDEQHEQHHDVGEEVQLPTFGIVVLRSTKGNKVNGTLRMIQQGEDLRIVGRIRNLTPGKHGFHIHEFGDLRGSDGTAAGGHFDPHGHEHGAPGKTSHVGDLGNITANEEGVASVNMRVEGLKLHFVLGRSLVVHAGEDDLTSQPSGDAGPRVAVGVIGVGNTEFAVGNGK